MNTCINLHTQSDSHRRKSYRARRFECDAFSIAKRYCVYIALHKTEFFSVCVNACMCLSESKKGVRACAMCATRKFIVFHDLYTSAQVEINKNIQRTIVSFIRSLILGERKSSVYQYNIAATAAAAKNKHATAHWTRPFVDMCVLCVAFMCYATIIRSDSLWFILSLALVLYINGQMYSPCIVCAIIVASPSSSTLAIRRLIYYVNPRKRTSNTFLLNTRLLFSLVVCFHIFFSVVFLFMYNSNFNSVSFTLNQPIFYVHIVVVVAVVTTLRAPNCSKLELHSFYMQPVILQNIIQFIFVWYLESILKEVKNM